MYVERLALLEDESSAVKLSLIQLLQDKAAVNKHLALENSHLHRELTVNIRKMTGGGGKLQRFKIYEGCLSCQSFFNI